MDNSMWVYKTGKRVSDCGIERSPKSVNQVETMTSQEEEVWIEKLPNFCIVGKNKLDGDPRPFTDVIIHNHAFRALIDTGAEVSLINDEVAEYLRDKGTHPRKKICRLSIANKSEVPATRIYEFSGELDGRSHRFSAIHLPSLSTKMILGMDVITPLKLINMKQSLKCEEVNLVNEDLPPDDHRKSEPQPR